MRFFDAVSDKYFKFGPHDHTIIIHPAISDSLYRVNVTTAPFFVVLNAPGDCAGSIIAGSDPKYLDIYLSLHAL